ncbi:hypothetical protein ACFVYP_37040 [Kitasatospora sp. NPDC058201]|uniref:hypothetical protein n=1 Tax=unclassified Kitasatospora TaxID=2633591 RepID=UPI0036533080
MTRSRGDARLRHPRHERRGEARLPAVLATLAAILLYVALPQQLLVAPRCRVDDSPGQRTTTVPLPAR